MAIELKSIQIVAISNFLSSKDVSKAKEDLSQGSEENIKFIVVFEEGPKLVIDSIVKKGMDVEKKVPAALPQKAMLMHLLAKMPVQVRDKFLRDFADNKIPELPTNKINELEEAWESVTGHTIRNTNGMVRVNSNVTIS